MYNTKSTIVKLSKIEYLILKQMSHNAKNLYNIGLYNVRQNYFNTNKYLNYSQNYKLLKNTQQYKLIPSDPAQHTLKMIEQNFKSFFSLLKLKQQGLYKEKIHIPNYLEKHEHYQLIFPMRKSQQKRNTFSINIPKNLQQKYNLKSGSRTISFQKPDYIKNYNLKEVRLCPKNNGRYFTIEWIYEVPEIKNDLDFTKFIALDPGINNFMTILDNKTGSPIILDGKYIKSLNRFYNKEISHKQNKSKNKQRLLLNRKNKIEDCLNQYSNFILQYCLINKIGNIIIGKGYQAGNQINLGKKTNQNFCYIPFSKFINKLQNKCLLNGIVVKLQQESYTSKCDHLAGETMEHHNNYLGKRIHRGLFKSSIGRLLNADVNGALGILIKSKSNVDLVQLTNSGLINNPRRITIQEIVNNSSINLIQKLKAV